MGRWVALSIHRLPSRTSTYQHISISAYQHILLISELIIVEFDADRCRGHRMRKRTGKRRRKRSSTLKVAVPGEKQASEALQKGRQAADQYLQEEGGDIMGLEEEILHHQKVRWCKQLPCCLRWCKQLACCFVSCTCTCALPCNALQSRATVPLCTELLIDRCTCVVYVMLGPRQR